MGSPGRPGKAKPSPSPAAVLEKASREDWGRLSASLIKTLGDFQLAEDSLQDAMESAIVHWTRNGVPRSASAWLLQTARRKAIDRIRRDINFRHKQAEYAYLLELDSETAMEPEALHIPDERLSLIFTCCHPALDEKSRVALTLRTLGGLTTPEIARAFLEQEATTAQRFVRAKQKIKFAAIPYSVPKAGDLPERLNAVLNVIYLVFNEGYAAANGEDWMRVSLCDEAIRLARIVRKLLPLEPEVSGLLALMLLNSARQNARVSKEGDIIPLDEQDRALWDCERIAEGCGLVQSVLRKQTVGPFLLQAAISAVHSEAVRAEDTDWPQIASLYAELGKVRPTPVVRLNHAIAVSYAVSPSEAQALIEPLGAELAMYQPYYAALADVLRRRGKRAEALAAYDRAISLSGNARERRFLENRRADVSAA